MLSMRFIYGGHLDRHQETKREGRKSLFDRKGPSDVGLGTSSERSSGWLTEGHCEVVPLPSIAFLLSPLGMYESYGAKFAP